MDTNQLKDKMDTFNDELKLQWACVRTMACSRWDGSTTDFQQSPRTVW
jgi:hypothetical protein